MNDGTFGPIVRSDNASGFGSNLGGDGVADFDEDGDIDFVGCDDFGGFGYCYLYSQTSPIVFEKTTDIEPNGMLSRQGSAPDLLAEDFDQDGHIDVLLGANSLSSVQVGASIYFGDGAGAFPRNDQDPLPSSASFVRRGADAADLDGNGFPDVIFASSTGEVYSYLNDEGTFTGPYQLFDTTGASSSPFAVAVADFDGDAFVDIIAGGSSDGEIALWKGNGANTFTFVRAVHDFDIHAAIDNFDFDEDGDQDLVAVARIPGEVFYFEANGDGTFQLPVSLGLAASNSFGIAAPPTSPGLLLPDIELLSAQLNDPTTVELRYETIENILSFDVSVYRSADGEFQPSVDEANKIGSKTVAVDGSGMGTIPIEDLPVNRELPYFLVVADPPSPDSEHGEILESNETNNDKSFLRPGIVWINRGSSGADSDNFEASYGLEADVARLIVDRAIADWQELIVDFNYDQDGNSFTDNTHELTVFAFDLQGTSFPEFLWGLLHLVFSQEDPTQEFYATPHFCLRQLGIVNAKSDQGKRYEVFRQAIARLAGVVYQNDHFYDPIRGEHRDVAFGFLKYSLPLDPTSSRAWRFVWDQQFFEFCYALRGSFQFDLDMYRGLDFASRRLFLFLTKLFWRRQEASADLQHLAVNVLGYSPAVPSSDLKIKVRRCLAKLLQANVIQLPDTAKTLADVFHKRGKGRYEVAFCRGAYFDRSAKGQSNAALTNSPAYDLLRTIGFNDYAIRCILAKYKTRMVQQWADITLAAVERKLVTKDPKAYFNYYIQRAASRESTPPDWWHKLRKQEERRRFEQQTAASPTIGNAVSRGHGFERAFDVFLESEAKDVFDTIMFDLTSQFTKAGQSDREAKQSAEKFARQHLRNRFVSEHPDFRESA